MRVDIAGQPPGRIDEGVLGMQDVTQSCCRIAGHHKRHRGRAANLRRRPAQGPCLPQQRLGRQRDHKEAEIGDHRKIARLSVVLVGHEQEVARRGQDGSAENRVQQQLAAPFAPPSQRRARHQHPRQRNQHVVHPQAAVKRPPEADQKPREPWRPAVVVDEEEILEVGQEAQARHQGHPKRKAEGEAAGRGQRTTHGQLPAHPQTFSRVSGCLASPEWQNQSPPQRRQKKDRSGLGEHHQGEEQADPQRGPDRAPHPRQPHGQIQSRQRERGQQRLQDCQPAEAIKERAGHHQSQGQQGHPARPAAAQKQVAQQQIGKEDPHRQSAHRLQRDAGKEEQKPLKKRPNGRRGGRVEVSRQVPVTRQVRANRTIAPPALVGVLGRVVHPGRMVRKIGAQMKRMKQSETEDENQPKGVKPSLG